MFYLMFQKMTDKRAHIRQVFLLLCAVLLTSCASTSVIESWVEPDLNKSYKNPMILASSDSQQTRRIYEQHFVDELKKLGVTAVPSYTLINSKQKLTRETVEAAIKDTDIDAVLVTYLVSADAELKHHDSPVGHSYTGSPEENMVSATMITTRGRTSSKEIINLKNDLFDAKSGEIVWSARTESVAPSSIDQVIREVTERLINGMIDDGVIKPLKP